MKIAVTDFCGMDVRVSLEAESEAESHQLEAIKSNLSAAGAHWERWNDMHGRSGVVVVAKKKPASPFEPAGKAP